MTASSPGITVFVPHGHRIRSPGTIAVATRLGGARHAIPVQGPDQPQDGPDQVLHLTCTPDQAVAAFDGCWIYRTEVHVVFDRLGDDEPATARTVLLRRNPALDHEGFVQRWTVGHAELAKRHHPGIGRYVQRVVVQRLTPDTPEGDGIACLAYRTQEDLELRQYDSPEGQEIIQADVAGFLDKAAGVRVIGPELQISALGDD